MPLKTMLRSRSMKLHNEHRQAALPALPGGSGNKIRPGLLYRPGGMN